MEELEINESLASVCLPGQTGNSLKIYNAAKANLGKHITLDENVPHELGCAEAASFILKEAGIKNFPQYGFSGTSALNDWLHKNFQLVDTPTPGCLIISPSGTSTKGAKHGHVGIIGKYGILSNDSPTGLFLERWSIEAWKRFYGVSLGFPVLIYQPFN